MIGVKKTALKNGGIKLIDTVVGISATIIETEL